MPTLTARSFPQYAKTTDPTILAAYLQAQTSYHGVLTAARALSEQFTGGSENAVISGDVLTGARLEGFRHLDPDRAPGRWTYRHGLATPQATNPRRDDIRGIVHHPVPLPGRPAGPLTGTDPDGAMLCSRGVVFPILSTLYSGYPMCPEEEFTTDPVGTGWVPIARPEFLSARSVWVTTPASGALP